MTDKSRVDVFLHDFLRPAVENIKNYLKSALANNGGRDYVGRDRVKGVIPEDKAGWDKLSPKKQDHILDNY